MGRPGRERRRTAVAVRRSEAIRMGRQHAQTPPGRDDEVGDGRGLGEVEHRPPAGVAIHGVPIGIHGEHTEPLAFQVPVDDPSVLPAVIGRADHGDGDTWL